MAFNSRLIPPNAFGPADAAPAADEIKRQDILQTIGQQLENSGIDDSSIHYILKNYVSNFIDMGIPEDQIKMIVQDPSAQVLIRQDVDPKDVLTLFQPKNTSKDYQDPRRSERLAVRDHILFHVHDPEFDAIEDHLTQIVKHMQEDPNNELLYPIYKMTRQIATIEPSFDSQCKELIRTILDQITQTESPNGRALARIDPGMVQDHLKNFINKILPVEVQQALFDEDPDTLDNSLDQFRSIVNPIMECANTLFNRFEGWIAPFVGVMHDKANHIIAVTKDKIGSELSRGRNIAKEHLQGMVYIDMIYGLDMTYITALNIYHNADEIYRYLVAAPGGILEGGVEIVSNLAQLLAGNIQSVREFYVTASSMGAGIPFNVFLFSLSLSSILYRQDITDLSEAGSYRIAEKIRRGRNFLMSNKAYLQEQLASEGASNLTNAIFITFRVSKQLAMMYYGTSPYLLTGFTCHVLYHFINSFHNGMNTVTISEQIVKSAGEIFGDLIPDVVANIKAIVSHVQKQVAIQDTEARAELQKEIEAYMREEHGGIGGGAKRRISHKKSKKHHSKKHHSKKHHSKKHHTKKHHSKKHHTKKHAVHKKRATKKHPVKKHAAKKRKTISKKYAKKSKHTKRQHGGLHTMNH